MSRSSTITRAPVSFCVSASSASTNGRPSFSPTFSASVSSEAKAAEPVSSVYLRWLISPCMMPSDSLWCWT